MVDDSLERAEARVINGTFKPISWSEVTQFIHLDRLDLLTRSPEALVHYQAWKEATVLKYGSIETFIITQRLHWTSLTPSNDPILTNPQDYCVLRNDFPYSFEKGITHLVVWTKHALPRTEQGIDPHTKNAIEEFVKTLGREVLWFLNPPTLKSIEGLEHFHVLIKE